MSASDWIDFVWKLATVILIPLFTYYNRSVNSKIDKNAEDMKMIVNEIRVEFKERDKKRDDDIEKLRKELHELQVNMPKEYVLREDFIRVTNNIENKLSDITTKIDDVIKMFKTKEG